MEFILHAANSKKRITACNEAFERLEVDVWYDAGALRVVHDFHLGPITFGHRHGRIHIGLLKDSPKLCEVLDIVSRPLLIDLKGAWDCKSIFCLVALLDEKNRLHKDAICTQDWRPLDIIRGNFPKVALYYSMERKTQLDAFFRKLADVKKEFGNTHGIAGISAAASLVIPHNLFIPMFHDEGLKVLVWDNIEDPKRIAALVAWGLDGAIVDSLP